ncbi:MAG: formate dehydrogenase accessory sulfurtransferase FdhD [Thermomonas sp.]
MEQRTPTSVRATDDIIACEVPVALHYNGVPFAVLMATPCDLADLALGFSLSEAIIEADDAWQLDDVREELEGFVVNMRIPDARAARLSQRSRPMPSYGGCGICGSASIEDVMRMPAQVISQLSVDEAALHHALDALHQQQPLNAQTGAIHAAGFANACGELLLVREDVGRHNALDKLIGGLHVASIPAGNGFAITTSRASFELAMKAAQTGIPLLAAISAPTTLAIALAQSTGLGLVGFARNRQCVVYAHPHRLRRTTP